MQDPQQAQQMAQHMLASMAPLFLLVGVIALAIWLFSAYLFWRLFTKAGLPGPLGLIALVPWIGRFTCECILAFSRWNVVPAPPQYGAYPPAGYPPQFPPQPSAYAPPIYPPQGPTA